MAVSTGFQAYLADQLGPLGPIKLRRVFGLDGVMADGILLGFVINERLYVRTDDETRSAYEAEGGKPFEFDKSNGEHIVTSYYTLPDRLYDEPDELIAWARRARAAALEAPSAKKRRAMRVRQVSRTSRRSKRK